MEKLTTVGWRLAGLVTGSKLEPISDVHAAYDSGVSALGMYGNPPGWKEHPYMRYEAVQITEYLLVMDDDSIIGHQTEQIAALEKEKLALTKKAADFEKGSIEIVKKDAILMSQIKDAQERITQLTAKCNEHLVQKSKFEVDLGKIRIAIGEKTIKDILAEIK